MISAPMTYPFVSVNCWFADGRHIGEIELDLANNNYTRWQFKARPGCWPTKFQNSDVVFKSVWIPIFVHFDGSNVECFIVCLSNLTNQNGNILKKRDTFVQENIWSMTKGRQNLMFFFTQRRWQNGNPKVLPTYGPTLTYGRTDRVRCLWLETRDETLL